MTITSGAHLDLAKINVLLCQVKHGLAEAEGNLGVEREYFWSERKKNEDVITTVCFKTFRGLAWETNPTSAGCGKHDYRASRPSELI